jgi:dihydrofolate synthase / folylpolyglutamate synthase
MKQANCFKDLTAWLAWLDHGCVKKNAIQSQKIVAKIIDHLKIWPSVPVITIAGTNGKGSCVACLEAMYAQAGLNVAAFTSPHIFKFNERIRFNTKPVTDGVICEAFAVIYATIHKELLLCDSVSQRLSYFQFVFLAALYIFAHTKLDLIVLEVGIGGRYDITNVVDSDVAVITSIDLDHCDVLGHTREKIARDKAGIMRAGKPVVCGDINPPTAIFIEAEKLGALLYTYQQDFSVEQKATNWNWIGKQNSIYALPYNTSVLTQNIATAIQTVNCLGSLHNFLALTDQSIIDAIRHLQICGRGQLFDVNGVGVLVDVAHNPAAVKVLQQKINKATHTYPGQKYAVFSMQTGKDILQTVACLQNIITKWFVANIVSRRTVKCALIVSILNGINADVEALIDIVQAFEAALQKAKAGDIIIVFGSFLVVSDVLQHLILQYNVELI